MKRMCIIAIVICLLLFLLALDLSAIGKGSEAHEGKNVDHLVINEVCYMTYPKACWFEVYNPTSLSFNTDWDNMTVSFYSVAGLLHTRQNVEIPPHGYIVICWNKTEFFKHWRVPEGTPVVELNGWGLAWDSICIEFSISNSSRIIDRLGEPNFVRIPPVAEGHTWARYKGGYDTDNFTNDFYDEPEPTPGYENHRMKEKEGQGKELYLFAGLIATVGIVVTATYIYYIKNVKKK